MTNPDPAPPDQFTYEEWVEATQACCGVHRPDPSGGRLVLLAHDWPEPHFDLFFEAGEVLKAFRLSEKWGGDFRAEAAAEHRPAYPRPRGGRLRRSRDRQSRRFGDL